MQYCSNCGGKLVPVTGGGCGGRGSLDGCPACDSVFVQTSGGILASTDGEHFAPSEWKYKELCWHLAKEIKVWQATQPETWDKKPNPHFNQWYWSEVGFGETHYFEDQSEALTWLAVYVQQLKNQLGWPLCDMCGQMAEKDYTYFRCSPCDQVYLKEGYGHPALWVKSDYSNMDEKLDQLKAEGKLEVSKN